MGMTVLLVDDEEGVRTLVGKLLKRWGFSVLLAENGEQALSVFDTNRDDVSCVLLDLQLPGMDGSQVLTRMREIDPRTRVILSSGYSREQMRDSVRGDAAVTFIQKPYGIADLKKKLQEVLGISLQ